AGRAPDRGGVGGNSFGRHVMKPVWIVLLSLSPGFTTPAPAQRTPGADSVKAELFAVYQRSHAVKLNRDSAGYATVFSHSFMQRLANVLVQQHITSFREYMGRVAVLERRTPASMTPAPRSASVTGDRAILTVLLPKACGEPAKPQDCL